MSNNVDFEALVEELRALRDAHEHGETPGLLIMRRLQGFSAETWRRFRQRYPNSRWGVLPLDDSRFTQALNDILQRGAADICPDACPPSPPAAQVLTRTLCSDLFQAQLERDLLRQQRTGGQFSLVCMALTEEARAREGSAEAIAHLAELAARHMESCDTLGALPDRGLALILPGIGPLRAKGLASRLHQCYHEQNGQTHPCGFGVLGLTQPVGMSLDNLLERIPPLLARACAHTDSIACESLCPKGSPDTLVQSREKRFLFFGGD